MMKTSVTCQTCKSGQMKLRRVYRMSMPVVVIGYILLIPSVIGILISIMLLFASGGATSAMLEDNEARQVMISAKVPNLIIRRVMNGDEISQKVRSVLSEEQNVAITRASSLLVAGKIGAVGTGAIGGGAAVCFGVSSLVSGLIGWLLIMKKKVLQCVNCSATITAS